MKKEIELKYRLKSKEDFTFFAHFLDPYGTEKKLFLRQENFYFDTPALHLRKADISLRLRKQNEDYFLSAKHSLGQKKPKNLSVRLELEGPISADVAALLQQQYLSPIEAFATLAVANEEEKATKKVIYRTLQKMAHHGLQIIGSFTNERTNVPIAILDHLITLEFDHSLYPESIETFEIEIEFESEKQANIIRPLLEELFHKANIKTYKSRSKSSRLYKILFG